MANYFLDNVYYVFDSAGTAVTNWPSGAHIAHVRLWTMGTNASAEFQLSAGTPWFRFDYLTHGGFAAGSGGAVTERLYVIPFFGKRQSTAFIPTTLTACTAWFELL